MNIAETYFFTVKWPLFYEDNHLLVVYKPSGLLIQGDRTEDISLLDLAKQWVKIRYEKPGNVYLAPVHRLDRPVAGVTVFARTSKAASRLSAQFREGSVKKRYLAVVEGVVTDAAGQLTDYLERRGATSRILDSPTKNSREARLSFRVIETVGDRSFLEIDLATGRHHQIRAQLANIGHPIVGDLRYGAIRPLPEKQLALFAAEIAFDHPTSKERMCFSSPLPPAWPWPGTADDPEAPCWNWWELAGDLKDQGLLHSRATRVNLYNNK
ncbi:MAG: RNA pseudouridine synthase [Desulfobacteraceae bacterium]|nr:RNA pseudouridine synthase [Desulfobacteraceae bacterium]MCF8095911.1 RNA pseudouridine synthase [Desulfobacteraceae bacterium]